MFIEVAKKALSTANNASVTRPGYGTFSLDLQGISSIYFAYKTGERQTAALWNTRGADPRLGNVILYRNIKLTVSKGRSD